LGSAGEKVMPSVEAPASIRVRTVAIQSGLGLSLQIPDDDDHLTSALHRLATLAVGAGFGGAVRQMASRGDDSRSYSGAAV
jgi:hypothetical protein